MRQSLPLAILTQVEALGAALAAAARAHSDGTLAAHEQAVRAAVQAALPGLLGAVVSLATHDLDAGLATVARRCPRCDRRVRSRGGRPRTVQTTCGPSGSAVPGTSVRRATTASVPPMRRSLSRRAPGSAPPWRRGWCGSMSPPPSVKPPPC